MNEDRSDSHLRQLFATARRQDSASTPPFAGAWAAAHRRARGGARRRRSRLLLAALSAVAMLALLLMRPVAQPAVASPLAGAMAIAAWRAPTDFLLATPGSDLLTQTPHLGYDPRWPGTSSSASKPANHG